MDSQYYYSLISFGVGSAAGFQGVYDRYSTNSIQAIYTPPGAFYLFSRGLIPALVFVICYNTQLFSNHFLLYSLVCGSSVELILRTKIFIKETSQNGTAEELLRGPFDLLQWYQNLLLQSVAEYLARIRKIFMEKNLPKSIAFEPLIINALNNLDAWPPSDSINQLKTDVQRIEGEYHQEIGGQTNGTDIDSKYKYKLGYLILNKKGPKAFKTLLTLTT